MVNLRLGWSLISLIAATSMLLVRRKSSSSAFLSKTELAYHASIRKLRVMGKEKDSQQPIYYRHEFGYWVARLLEL